MRLAEKRRQARYEPALIFCWWIGPGKKRKLEKDDPMLVRAAHSKDPVPNLAPRKKQSWLESGKYIVVLLLRTTFASEKFCWNWNILFTFHI